MAIRTFTYESEFTRSLRDEGRVEGKAEGVLTVLDARGIAVPDHLRERIAACRDADLLDTWLRRAAVVTSAADLEG